MSDEPVLELAPLGIAPMWWAAGAVVLLVVVLVLRVVYRVVHERSSSPITAGEVVGVVGRPGAGKTYFAVKLALAKLSAGATVATNFSMTLPPGTPGTWVQWSDWEDLLPMSDAIVIVDEAHLYAPAGTNTLPTEVRWKLSQVRRFNLSLYWVTQHHSNVAKRLRDLTNYVWVCNSFRGGKTFRARLYEPHKLTDRGDPPEGDHLEIRRYKLDPEVCKAFDTWEILTGEAAVGKTESGDRLRKIAVARNDQRTMKGKPIPRKRSI